MSKIIQFKSVGRYTHGQDHESEFDHTISLYLET